MTRSVLVLLVQIPVTVAFDWGDFHKVAVIFFSFFGPGVILGAIALVAYFACIRSWYESVREDIRETHRSFHPWPPGSAKWQLQRYINGAGPPPIPQQKSVPPTIKTPTATPIPPGYLASPMPNQASTVENDRVQRSHSSLQPSSTDPMNSQMEKRTTPLPLEIYCPPSATYVPYTVTSPYEKRASSPGYSLIERGPSDDTIRILPQPTLNDAGQQIEAITVRTTTTTRRTTVLSPVQRPPYTIV
ncbi:hypothetical protein Q1695_005891 [Nippostrongylus brasiliensis]|nr:hypothetical protein Q1695_005891 [Nippostrongylus brasiliensis]